MGSEKLEQLRALLGEMEGAIVAFSGGVDSSFLLSVAVEVLGARALAVTALSPIFTASEGEEAAAVARALGARYELLITDQLEIPDFVANDGRRCYFCRVDLFSRLRALAEERAIPWVLDGTLVDDLEDVRPGLRARGEQGVRSPLLEVGLTKAEVRDLACARGLPNWDKPSESCLASRVPLGMPVTFELLDRIGKAEAFLRRRGFRQVRVRHHGAIARIEVGREEIVRLLDEEMRAAVAAHLQALGYAFVTVDLLGYRTGSMNTRRASAVVGAAPSR